MFQVSGLSLICYFWVCSGSVRILSSHTHHSIFHPALLFLLTVACFQSLGQPKHSEWPQGCFVGVRAFLLNLTVPTLALDISLSLFNMTLWPFTFPSCPAKMNAALAAGQWILLFLVFCQFKNDSFHCFKAPRIRQNKRGFHSVYRRRTNVARIGIGAWCQSLCQSGNLF